MDFSLWKIRPLAAEDDDALFAALSPDVWRLALTPFGRNGDTFREYMALARSGIREGTAEVFTVLLNGIPVGMTRLSSMETVHRSAELGATWYREDLWGSGINAFAKLMVLRRAFEELMLIRVFFRIDARNKRSQRAVARLGAVREGVLRRDRILPDGHPRDTVVFSILQEEWPEIEAGLVRRLNG